MRRPSLLERIVYDITCIGFCEVDERTVEPDKHLAHCAEICGAKLPYPTLQASRRTPILPSKSE